MTSPAIVQETIEDSGYLKKLANRTGIKILRAGGFVTGSLFAV